MADSLTLLMRHPLIALLKRHPLVESVKTATFFEGEPYGVGVKLRAADGKRKQIRAIRASSYDEAASALLKWVEEGKA